MADRTGPLGDRSLKNDVYAEIVALIHRGDLHPGDRISEADIATRLGISRAPVREAFAQLGHEGLIVRKPRTGNFVAHLTQTDMEDIRDARVLLEGHAASRACKRITPDGADTLHRIISAMEAAARERQWTEAAALNARFHQTVFQIAGSAILDRLWRALDPLAWLLAPAALPGTDHIPEGLVVRHQVLVDALLSGDPDQASEAFREHVAAAAWRTARLDAPKPTESPVDREISTVGSNLITRER